MDKDTTKGTLPSVVEFLVTRFTIADKSISPRMMANLEQQRDKKLNEFL